MPRPKRLAQTRPYVPENAGFLHPLFAVNAARWVSGAVVLLGLDVKVLPLAPLGRRWAQDHAWRCVTLVCRGRKMAFGFGPDLLAALCPDGLPGVSLGQAEVILDPLISPIETALGSDIDIVSVVEGPSPASSRSGWQTAALRLSGPKGVTGEMLVHAQTKLWPQIASIWPVPVGVSPQLPVRIHAGETRVSKAMLAELKSGDVLLGRPHPFLSRAILNVAGRPALRLVLEHGALCIGTIAGRKQKMTAPKLNAADDITLEVGFELEPAELSLDEIATLQVGQVLVLENDLGLLPISIVVGGDVIASGELVEIGGEIGVQITALHRAD